MSRSLLFLAAVALLTYPSEEFTFNAARIKQCRHHRESRWTRMSHRSQHQIDDVKDDAMRSNSEGRQGAALTRVSRAQALSSTSLFLAVTAPATLPPYSPVSAAVPTIQEYYGGEGSKPKTNNYLNKKEKAPAAPSPAAIKPPADPKQLLTEAYKELGSFPNIIKEERWNDLLAATKKGPLAFLLTPYLGYGSSKGLAEALGGSVSQIKSFEESRQDLGVTLQQLVDYAFSNRVIFFNALDKQQVAELASGRESTDLSEPLGLLDDVNSLLASLAQSIG